MGDPRTEIISVSRQRVTSGDTVAGKQMRLVGWEIQSVD